MRRYVLAGIGVATATVVLAVAASAEPPAPPAPPAPAATESAVAAAVPAAGPTAQPASGPANRPAAPGRRAPTHVTGWSALPTTGSAGSRVSVPVRVRTGDGYVRRSVAVRQRAADGTWTTVATDRTGRKGRLTARWTLPGAGTWGYRLRVTATASAQREVTKTRSIAVTGGSGATPTPTPTTTAAPTDPAASPAPTSATPETVTAYAAADIGLCGGMPAATAALLAGTTGPVFAAGDLAYPSGSARDFADCYDPTWGAVKERTYPVPGNHEYYTTDAAGYFGYFGSRVGTAAASWYSIDVGAWHVVLLNSNCAQAGGCSPGSPQYAWLQADLAARPGTCLAAVWHHPVWSDGTHGPAADMTEMYALLESHGADLLLSGHNHNYVRFARATSAGVRSSTGIRQFIVGMGGSSPLYVFDRTSDLTEERSDTAFGVLRLDLRPDGYDWRFLPAAGSSYADSGSDTC